MLGAPLRGADLERCLNYSFVAEIYDSFQLFPYDHVDLVVSVHTGKLVAGVAGETTWQEGVGSARRGGGVPTWGGCEFSSGHALGLAEGPERVRTR